MKAPKATVIIRMTAGPTTSIQLFIVCSFVVGFALPRQQKEDARDQQGHNVHSQPVTERFGPVGIAAEGSEKVAHEIHLFVSCDPDPIDPDWFRHR